jgi:hypothetical protein
MTCEVFDIQARGDGFKIVSFDSHRSFTLGPLRHESSDIVVREAGWTLFSFDFNASKAVFLDIGDDCDLSKAPFCYLVQFERAKRQALISFADFFELAERLPDPKKLVQLFNMGHCGSTLLHHVFNRVPNVWCISEPIYFVNMAMERASVDEATLQKLARAGLRFLNLFEGAAKADLMIVKHFSQSTTQFKTLYAAMPGARCMFMYRDGKSWTNSLYHFVQKVGGSMIIERDKREFAWWIMSGNCSIHELDGVVDLDADVVTFDTLAAAAWALHIRQYNSAIADGVPMMAVRYNELTHEREKTITRIFKYCGISNDSVAGTLDAFDADSQKGTRTARSIAVSHFDDENYRRVTEVFANPRVAVDANLILSDSFKN